jgi:hypothetical chaperone protein
VRFQYEPIAAALDHEHHATREQLVLVADIGGGTSDFSLVRVGPERRARVERRDDIPANHSVHAAGTDFDRHIERRLGHALAALAEQAKIDVADAGQTRQALDAIEAALAVSMSHEQAMSAIAVDLDRVIAAARETPRHTGLQPDAVDVLYLTGGSTGLSPLARHLADVCPSAMLVRGDRFASVVNGLGLHAQRCFAPPTAQRRMPTAGTVRR